MQSGDKCPKCNEGRMKVRTSRRVGESQEQRLECTRCQHKKTVEVPAAFIWHRRRQTA